jgi:hypothetical protein
MLTEKGSSVFIGSPVILIPRSVSHHRPGVRDDQPSQYDTNDWFSIENESLFLCSLAVISLRIPWVVAALRGEMPEVALLEPPFTELWQEFRDALNVQSNEADQ